MSARTPSGAASRVTAPRARGRRAFPLLALTALALLAGLAGAAPAAAVDDTTRPDARVTHGPSCRPGGVVVEVVAGSAPYAVTLATTREPDGEDFAELAPGDTVVLRTGGVAWGETVDGRLEYRALDGSGATWVDELAGYTFTRPAEEDCAAITAPAPATVPSTVPGPEPLAPVADGPGPARVIEPGGAGAGGSAEEVATVEVAAASPVPALDRRSSGSPALVAALALAAAAVGLGSTLAGPGLRRRRPTAGA